MSMLKLHMRARRIISLVMIMVVVQVGLLGNIAPVLAKSAAVSDSVYQTSSSSSGVTGEVYGSEVPGPTLPTPLTFLKKGLPNQLSAASGTFTVSGQVYENSTNMPLAGVEVLLLLNGHPTQFRTSTDSQGSYNLTGIGQGEYLLTFQLPGYAPEKFGVNITGTDLIQDCNLFRNTSFKGQVVNELGDALEGVQVTLADQNMSERNIQLSTNVDGWFYLVDVPAGRYLLTVSNSVYQKNKMVWVDEYPHELKMVLREASSVTGEVYGETPIVVKPDDELNDESNNEPDGELPNIGDEVYGKLSFNNIFSIGYNIGSLTAAEVPVTEKKDEPSKTHMTWSSQYIALKEQDSLNELEQLLKQEVDIA